MKTRVVILSAGRFHHFHLGRQLESRGLLDFIVTGMPRCKLTDEPGIPDNKIISLPYVHALYRAFPQSNAFLASFKKLLNLIDIYLLGFVTGFFVLRQGNILVVNMHNSSPVLVFFCRLKHVTVICDAPQAHPTFVNKILLHEYSKAGLCSFNLKSGIAIKHEIECINYADIITVPSKFVKDTFISESLRAKVINKIKIVPYGLSSFSRSSPLGDSGQSQAGISSTSDFNLLYVGALSFRKGSHLLLKAIQKLAKYEYKINFTLVGSLDPELNKYIDLKSFLNQNNNVRWLGVIKKYQVENAMRQASALIHPTLCEGQALVLGEALSTGLPFFTTKASGFPFHLISHIYNPLICADSITEDSLIAFLRRLASNKTLVANIKNNLQSLATLSYNWNDYGDSWDKIISDLK